jgi:hypothetical protein
MAFFFEKKQQKTFATLPLPAFRHGRPAGRRADQKFFGAFFQKRPLPLG